MPRRAPRRVSLLLEDAALLYEFAVCYARHRRRERDPIEPKATRAIERVRQACYDQAQGTYDAEIDARAPRIARVPRSGSGASATTSRG